MFQFDGFNMVFPESLRNFQSTYKAFSVSMLPGNERHDVERGGKIIMPPSALDILTRLNVEYPMLFKLINVKKSRTSHAGVLEFVADEGKCYLPNWMMDNLLLEEGEMLTIESLSLPVATFSKFQPHTTDFLDITNPKAVLENALRNFACLTTGDVIAIKYNKKVYQLCVLETEPGRAVSIIECDMNVDFEAPVGYKEQNAAPCKEVMNANAKPEAAAANVTDTFFGSGNRLDGKKKKDGQQDAPIYKKVVSRGTPEYDYKFGILKFVRYAAPVAVERQSEAKVNGTDLEGFDGQGFVMRKFRN